jgi:hypothetical protein
VISYEIRKARAAATGIIVMESIQSKDAVVLPEFFEVSAHEFTEFTWDGPDDDFPHEFITFVGKENEAVDELLENLIVNLGLSIPELNSAGIPGKNEGWDRRLAFSPGNTIYFGVTEFSEKTSTQIGTVAVPITLNAEEWWGAEYFHGLKAV